MRHLQLHDRAVLAGGRLLLGSRFARAFLAIYSVLLHFFVLLLIYNSMGPGRAAASSHEIIAVSVWLVCEIP